MLQCNVDLHRLERECGNCRKCKAVSKGSYYFDKDLKGSTVLVQQLENLIQSKTPYSCRGPEIHKDPDIRVLRPDGTLLCRIEAKMLNDKPFMKVHELLSGHDLFPKETIVVDTPKLDSYLKRRAEEPTVPTFIVWTLGRPCEGLQGSTIFQSVDVLGEIRKQKGNTRIYQRRTGNGDFVNGKQMGITQKYHFSVRECRPIEELVEVILSL